MDFDFRSRALPKGAQKLPCCVRFFNFELLQKPGFVVDAAPPPQTLFRVSVRGCERAIEPAVQF
jgi:hypothetical protein